MNKPDPLERALIEISDEAEGLLRSITPSSLNLIVEIVENRAQKKMRERRVIFTRWLVGIAVPVIVGLSTVIYRDRAGLNAELSRVESGIKAVTNDTHTTAPVPSPDVSSSVIPQTRRTLAAGSSTRFPFNVETAGLYLIDVVGDGDFDSYIELYQINGSAQTSLGSDDDGGDGLDSRMLQELALGNYELEVSELFGEAGDVTVSVTLLQSSDQ